LQNPSQTNGNNVNNVRQETIRIFRNERGRGDTYLKDQINKVETNYENKNIRNLYTGTNVFKEGHQHRN
jgi:predicted nuclease of restriction endonuclease-like RecB superfamily